MSTLLGHLAYVSVQDPAQSMPWAAACAAVVIGLVSYTIAGRVGVPPLVVVVPALVPMLPGLLIYRGLSLMSDGDTPGHPAALRGGRDHDRAGGRRDPGGVHRPAGQAERTPPRGPSRRSADGRCDARTPADAGAEPACDPCGFRRPRSRIGGPVTSGSPCREARTCVARFSGSSSSSIALTGALAIAGPAAGERSRPAARRRARRSSRSRPSWPTGAACSSATGSGGWAPRTAAIPPPASTPAARWAASGHRRSSCSTGSGSGRRAAG